MESQAHQIRRPRPGAALVAAGVALAMLRLASPVATAALQPVTLTCDGAVNPLGVDASKIPLAWKLASGDRGERQTKWQVKVASAAELLASDHPDLWDSGEVASDATQGMVYGGVPLLSSQRVFWQVRVWNRDGVPSAWSQPAQWTMGLLAATDWKGGWIAAPANTESLLLRREFAVREGLRRAVVHVCGLGQYELRLNGAKVGRDFLSPGWTDYEKTALYDTMDVTALLRSGGNAVGIFLGSGMYDVVRRDRFAKFTSWSGPLRAILHLRLEYNDGSVQYVGSDERWRTWAGPVTGGGIYGGEDFDARLDPLGWDRVGFDDRAWLPAVRVLRENGRLMGQSGAAEPLREIEVQTPVAQRAFPDGSVVYDLGQNASHIPRIRVIGPAGSRVRIRPSEIVNPDGTINPGTMGEKPDRGYAWWQYIKRTDGPETWEPRFSYIGCRYFKVEFYPAQAPQSAAKGGAAASLERPSLESIVGVVVHSIAAPVGEFSASENLLDRIHSLVRWAQRSNLVSILTDCPHREKLGWLEQYHLNGPSLRYEFDVNRIYAKGMHDMADAQHANGLMPETAPDYAKFKPPFDSAAEWDAAFILVPWQQYEFTGDPALLRAYYPKMARYFSYLETRAQGDILSEGLGDWYDLGPKKPGYAQLTPAPITATAFFYYDAAILQKTAAMLGKAQDASHYAARADRIKASFNRRFFDPARGSYGAGGSAMADDGEGGRFAVAFPPSSQCANAMPLVMGIVEPAQRERVLATLVSEVEANGGEMNAGDVGFRYLLRALADGGRSDVIYRMINQDRKPGYAFQLAHGETSLTESWDANNHSSHDHFMLGQIMEWFYHDLAGLQCDPEKPGFSHIVIRPAPVGDLAWVKASYDSVRGQVAVRWERQPGKFLLQATVPPNTTATIYLPVGPDAAVSESGAPARSSPGVRYLRRDGDREVYTVDSGVYAFSAAF